VATIPKVRAAPTTLAYYQVLQEMCAQLHDGHPTVHDLRAGRDTVLEAALNVLKKVRN